MNHKLKCTTNESCNNFAPAINHTLLQVIQEVCTCFNLKSKNIKPTADKKMGGFTYSTNVGLALQSAAVVLVD